MAVPVNHRHGSPLQSTEYHTMHLLDEAKRLIQQARERVAESKTLQSTSAELLDEIERKSISSRRRPR